MGGACINGGGTFEEMLTENGLEQIGEFLKGRYNILVKVIQSDSDNKRFEVYEFDKNKGSRHTIVHADFGVIKETYIGWGNRE